MLEPIGNSVAVITGVIQLLHAIHRSIDAVRDAPQQVSHLRQLSGVTGNKIKRVEKALQQISREYLDDDHIAYLESISGLVEILHTDLNDIENTIKIHNLDNASNRWLGRWKRYGPTKAAVDMKLNLNKKALERIERSMEVLTWTTIDLDDMKSKSQQPEQTLNMARGLLKHLADEEPSKASVETPLDADATKNSQADSQLQLQSNILLKKAFNQAKQLTERSIVSSSQSSLIPSRPRTPVPPHTPPTESDVGRMELKFRFKEALRLTKHAGDQGFPDVAATFHQQAMTIRSQLYGDADFAAHSTMEVEHIRILLKCLELSQQRSGLARLEALTAEIDKLSANVPPAPPETLFQARLDIGHLYYDMQRYRDAIRHHRDALFKGDIMSNHTQHREIIRALFKTICSAYEMSGASVELGGFRSTIKELIGDPLVDPAGDEALFEFLGQTAWKVNPDVDGESPSFGDMRDSEGNNPLHIAVMPDRSRMDTNIVRRLSVDPSALNAKNNDGLTPLFLAVKAKDIKLVTILLDEGANMDVRMRPVDLSLTILHCCESPVIMDLLLNRITPMRSRTMSEGVAAPEPVTIDSKASCSMTPLHRACERNDYETAEVLVKHGANVNSLNSDGQTALIMACYGVTGGVGTNKKAKSNMIKLVKLLVGAGSNVDVVDLDNRTAMKGLQKSGFSRDYIRSLLSWEGSSSSDSGVGLSPSSSLRSRITS